MTGGKQYLDRITMTLTNRQRDKMFNVYIDVWDTSLSRKWLQALNYLLANNYHLEKNYCFFGWEKSDRNLEYLCNQINLTFDAINNSSIDYHINDFFSPDNCMTSGPVGQGLPGMKIVHDKFNQLHRYFEDTQGVSGAISEHYKRADSETRWHIRQLNLLCHEAESLILSMRKAISAPDWRRPSQLMCWLNAPRFTLEEEDLQYFGIDALAKNLGGVFVGVNKAVGKHHWEVYTDEGRDSRIDELTTTTLKTQTEAAGDFDIEWAQCPKGYPFYQEQIDGFKQWLVNNGFDPEDPSLTIGHPQVAQVDLLYTFGSDNYSKVWEYMEKYLDVYSIFTSDAGAVFDYHWSDDNYMQQQVEKL
jgi:hypothetical protein